MDPSIRQADSPGPPAGVRRQVVLPLGKSLEIAFKSLQVRFFRSLITTVSLVLAIAFLGFVNVDLQVVNGLLRSADPELRAALERDGYDVTPETRNAAASPKQRWIVVLSLLVCVVGIVNAQLMAVTERFREIGTMKCLGALDRFIVKLFVLEAGMQGLCGAFLGALLGAGAALASGLWRYGLAVWHHVAWPPVLAAMAGAVGVGCLLSLAGVLYPALMAARMEPVEAMRAEQ